MPLPSHPFDTEEPIASRMICRRSSRKVTRVAENRSDEGPPACWWPAEGHGGGIVLEQPYEYSAHELVEPDWTRLPGFADVTPAQWRSAQWQRVNCVKNLRQLRGVYGDLLDDSFYLDVEADQAGRATMSLLLPPQMLNTMVPGEVPTTAAMLADPVRRYMLPVASDRLPGAAASHPYAARDSLHEHEMWAVEGLTHRYPTKVLAELIPTCPQYCGHCTRMDLVGNDTLQVLKYKFETKQSERWDAMLDYLRRTPSVRDVVVSGGDMANVPIKRLRDWLLALMDIENVRDIRIATKGLMGIPQHFLQDEVLAGYDAIAKRAHERGVEVAIHTHVNAAQQITPLVGNAVRKLLDMGYRDVRNQGVLLRGVNTTPNQILELCFTLLDHAKIMPYYFYLCDMIPNSEHWRLAVSEAQELQFAIMGYLPGFATPRFVCDVPFVGKRWVHMVSRYDHVKGITYWTKNYRTGIEYDDPEALSREYPYYDPIYTLPEEGKRFWREFMAKEQGRELQPV